MARGLLWLPRPVDPQSFGVNHLIVDGDKWYGKFFPGWPAALAVGVLAGVPWLVNPLLGAGSILLAHVLVRRLYGIRTAHAVVVLLAVSPWLLYLSGSFMAHAASLFVMLLAFVAIDVQRERQAGIWAVVAGGSLGLLFLTRPFDAMLVGPVAGLWALGVGARRLSVASLSLAAMAAALVGGILFWYSALLTGHALLPPHQLWADHLFGPGVERLGFGPDVGIPLWRNMDPLPGHGAADVVLNANKNFSSINVDLFGWASGSLALACLAFQRGGLGRRDWLMLGVLLFVIGGHTFYWAPGGSDFGARYWYLTIVPFAVLTVRGIQIVMLRLPAAAGRLGALLAVASLSALAIHMPWRAETKYDHYRGIGREIAEIADAHGITNALVFVRSNRRADYQAAFNFNSPLLDGPGNVFAQDLGDAHAATVMAGFPGRQVWVVGRESDAAPLSVLGGPFAPGTKPHSADPPPSEVLQAIIR
jgi:4-amino-4-deoxy-L-arabinose transferase-like glycosyltransferase